MFTFLFFVAVAVTFTLLGAYSHKYLAAQAAKVGINAQAVADEVNKKV